MASPACEEALGPFSAVSLTTGEGIITRDAYDMPEQGSLHRTIMFVKHQLRLG